MRKNTIAAMWTILFFIVSENAIAQCKYLAGQRAQTLRFTMPNTINISPTTPNGTTVYTTARRLINPGNDMNCVGEFYYGSMDARGHNVSSGIYPIGDTGLAWQWRDDSSGVKQYPAGMLFGGRYTFNETIHGFNIIKIASIKSGTKIPSGILGYYQDSSLTPLAIETTESNVVSPACYTPDNISINLGRPMLSELKDSINEPSTIHIGLTNCPQNIKGIQFSLIPTVSSPTLNSNNGIIGLNSSSTARGIAIQLSAPDGSVIDFNKKHLISDFVIGSGNASIDLSAKYIKYSTSTELKPGTANAEIMYLVEYP